MVIRIEHLGIINEITNSELVDLIVFEHYLADHNAETIELETAVFSVLAQIQTSEMAFQIAPQYGVLVDPEVFTARVRSHLLLEENGEQSAGDREFDEKLKNLLETVGITEDLYTNYVRKSLFLEALQARIESQDREIDFQLFLNEARDQLDLEIDLNSDINGWIEEQVQLRVQ